MTVVAVVVFCSSAARSATMVAVAAARSLEVEVAIDFCASQSTRSPTTRVQHDTALCWRHPFPLQTHLPWTWYEQPLE